MQTGADGRCAGRAQVSAQARERRDGLTGVGADGRRELHEGGEGLRQRRAFVRLDGHSSEHVDRGVFERMRYRIDEEQLLFDPYGEVRLRAEVDGRDRRADRTILHRVLPRSRHRLRPRIIP